MALASVASCSTSSRSPRHSRHSHCWATTDLLIAPGGLLAERGEFSAHRCTEGPEPGDGFGGVEEDDDGEQDVACGGCGLADLDGVGGDEDGAEPREVDGRLKL